MSYVFNFFLELTRDSVKGKAISSKATPLTSKDGNFSCIEWCEYGMESQFGVFFGHFDHLPVHLLGGDGSVRVVQNIDAARSV